MNSVKCPELVEWVDGIILLCKKADKPYVPNLSEIHSYCKTKKYDKCPYSAKIKDLMPHEKKTFIQVN
ncbi:MAG: hypothetical protein HY808_04785 [Nitrospirae bacterium]|nr:hypothetical protein [Nitrospirota bacterium]